MILLTLNTEGLKHKIPRIGFQNKFYYQTIIHQVLFGLILQGYIKQIVIFYPDVIACQLLYLFSSYKKFVEYAIKIFSNGNENFSNFEFLFMKSEKRRPKYDKIQTLLNVFSFQCLFYAFDECQRDPFLSKKKTVEHIDIPQDIVASINDKKAEEQIQRMKQQNAKISAQIKSLIKEKQEYLDGKKKVNAQSRLKRNRQKDSMEIVLLKKQLSKIQQKITEQNQNLKQLQNQKSQAMYRSNSATISKNQKIKQEKEVQQMKDKINQLQSDSSSNTKSLKQKLVIKEKQYANKLLLQKNEYEMLQKCKIRIKDQESEKKNLIRQRDQINQNIYFQENEDTSFTQQYQIKWFQSKISLCQQQIQKLQQARPEQLKNVQDEKSLIQKVVKKLVRQWKEEQHQQQLKKSREFKKQILQKSNMPKIQKYQFLRMYIRGEFAQNNKKSQHISNIYRKIITDGSHIEKLQKQQNKQIEICNVIIFYLSYICNKSFSTAVNQFFESEAQLFENERAKRVEIKKKISTCSNFIQFNVSKIENIPLYLRNKSNSNFNNLIYEINQTQIKLSYYKEEQKKLISYANDPRQQLKNFINKVLDKIKKLSSSQVGFLQILFGFYQCRIIRQCEPLQFIANQYVLVKHSSIVLEKLLKQNKKFFAYYIDQDNETVICRFIDVQLTILGLIQQKHFETTSNLSSKHFIQMKNTEHRNLRTKYINTEILGWGSIINNKETQQLLRLTKLLSQSSKSIEAEYTKFLNKTTINGIKTAKKKILEYYFGNRLNSKDQYFFVSHQLREYYFLEQMILSMKIFNYELFKNINNKAKMLEGQYKRYTERGTFDRAPTK